VTQDDLALRIAGLRPGEAPFLQPLGADPQVVFIMPHFTMWLISRELSGPVPVPWGSVFQAVPVQAGEKISRFPKTACSTPTVHTRSAAPQQYIHVRWQAAMSDSIPLQDAQLARDSANLTTLFFRSSGHYNTDPAIRTGGLVRRFGGVVERAVPADPPEEPQEVCGGARCLSPRSGGTAIVQVLLGFLLADLACAGARLSPRK